MNSRSQNGADLEKAAREAESKIATSKSKSEAIDNAIKAVELYLKALKLTEDLERKNRLKDKASGLIKDAESIKRNLEWKPIKNLNVPEPALSSPVSLRFSREDVEVAPESNRPLTTREKIILLESSKLNGFIFAPWKDSPTDDEFSLANQADKFLDQPDLSLPHRNKDIFDGWKRPEHVLPPKNTPRTDDFSVQTATMQTNYNMDLVQDITTDCSFVASLCSGVARAERGHPKIISSVVFPFDRWTSRPAISPNGKYIFRFYFNGCFRKIIIDDRLPASRTERVLHVVDRNNPNLLWPALIEKAYLKVRGGYEFPGSNSGTDLWILSGWIPEQVHLQKDDTVPSQLWRCAYNSFSYGDVLVTLGTGSLSKEEEATLGLAGNHDYAVLDMKEVNDHRLLLVKNPWASGTIWKGNDTAENFRITRNSWPGTTTEAAIPTENLPPGTFWIDLYHVMQNFESMYLNWNPALFKYRQDYHFKWELTKDEGPVGSFGNNPQYMISTKTGGAIWILLARHFKTEDNSTHMLRGRHEEFRDIDDPAAGKPETGYISLYVFSPSNPGHRVLLSDNPLMRGPYVDSPNTLVKIDAPVGGATYTIVVSQQYLLPLSYSFTLSAYSRGNFQLAPAKERFAHCTEYIGAWTSPTAGGNMSSPSYPLNPQFSIDIPTTTDIRLLLECIASNVAVHVKLVFGGGRRVTSVTNADIICASGDYRRGCALAEMKSVSPGTYTIVCSTFEAGQLSKFNLRVGSMVPCPVKQIPAESAGRVSLKLPLARFDPGISRILAPITVRYITRFKAIARRAPTSSYDSRQAKSHSGIKIVIELGKGPDTISLVESFGGEFSDAPMGVRTEDIDLNPTGMRESDTMIVLERSNGSSERSEDFEVEALTDSIVEIGPWKIDDD